MRKIRFLKSLTLRGVFAWEQEEHPKEYKAKFAKGEELVFFEWARSDGNVTFLSTDDPGIMRRADPDYVDKEGLTLSFPEVPLDSIESVAIPATPRPPKPVATSTQRTKRHPILDSACIGSDDDLEFPTMVAGTA